VMTKDIDPVLNGDPIGEVDIMHICFQYSDIFLSDVEGLQKEYKPKYTVIHSTVPVGTSRKLNAIHSPIRGVHPNLEEGIRTFPKFLGGEQASEVADYFRRLGMKVILFDKQETTEALKLFDTEYYKVNIEFAQRVKRFCDKHNLNFSEVYTIPNQTYNEGYTKLGMPEVVRPVLQPIMKEIGGHCLLPNSKMLKEDE
jgi:UDP-N-acetyl-D-mannosaminuronate dehydrogenase